MNPNEPLEERLALFIDHENVAIGARDNGIRFEIAVLLDALAERGRLLVKRAYADWNLFRDDRRGLVDGNVELIEIPQRSDSIRKNAADIQMAVDAMELALTRDYVSTFVIVSGDSDFTPLVAKLRELNRRVIGVGMKGSTSKMLPGSCDEFMFYDRLDGAQDHRREPRSKPSGQGRSQVKKKTASAVKTTKGGTQKQDLQDLYRLISQTLSGLQHTAAGPVLASNLKRALLRKDPTFAEADYGFRGFRELLKQVEKEGHVTLSDGSAQGDPEVDVASGTGGEDEAFALLKKVVIDLMAKLDGDPPLSGLKDQLRKQEPNFSEKVFGYNGFLQFCKAAATKDIIEMDWDEEDEEYYLYVEDSALPAKA